MFEASFQGQSFSTAWWPAALAGLGALCCLLGALGLAWQPRHVRGNPVRFILLVPVVGVALMALGLLPAWAAWELGRDLLVEGTPGPRPARIFHDLLSAELLAWVCAAGVLGLGGLLHLVRGRPQSPPPEPLPLIPAALGLLLAAAGPVHACLLLAMGPLPLLELQQPLRVHQGRSIQLDPELAGCARPEDWSTASQTLTPEQPGVQQVTLRAASRLVAVQRGFELQVGEDRGDPLLPLVAGHRWSWRHMRDWHNHFLWFFPDKGHAEGPLLQLEVLGPEEHGPLLAWRLEEQVEEGESSEHLVYRWDGQLLWFDDQAGPGDTPFFSSDDSSESLAHDPEGQPQVGCRLALFPNSSCRCLLHPEGQAALGGPSVCSPDPSLSDDMRALGSLFLGLMTAGLVIIDPDDDARWVLVESAGATSQ